MTEERKISLLAGRDLLLVISLVITQLKATEHLSQDLSDINTSSSNTTFN